MTYKHMMIFRTGNASAKFETEGPVDQTHDEFRAEIEQRLPHARFEAGNTRAAGAADSGLIAGLERWTGARARQAAEGTLRLLVHKLHFSWDGAIVQITSPPTEERQDELRERVLATLPGAHFVSGESARVDDNLMQVMEALAAAARENLDEDQDPNGAAAEGQP